MCVTKDLEIAVVRGPSGLTKKSYLLILFSKKLRFLVRFYDRRLRVTRNLRKTRLPSAEKQQTHTERRGEKRRNEESNNCVSAYTLVAPYKEALCLSWQAHLS